MPIKNVEYSSIQHFNYYEITRFQDNNSIMTDFTDGINCCKKTTTRRIFITMLIKIYYIVSVYHIEYFCLFSITLQQKFYYPLYELMLLLLLLFQIDFFVLLMM